MTVFPRDGTLFKFRGLAQGLRRPFLMAAAQAHISHASHTVRKSTGDQCVVLTSEEWKQLFSPNRNILLGSLAENPKLVTPALHTI